VRILYLADIRFPLERANGIQTMETCHALARRGHDVDLVVRPDSHTPQRSPFAYYGLPAIRPLRLERVAVTGPSPARRLGFLAFAAGRSIGQRADLIFTRDLGIAAMLLRLPALMRPPLVYESHGYAPEVSAALPELIATASAPSAAKLRRLARREVAIWTGADGYVTITHGLADDLRGRFGARSNLAVVPDGVRIDDVRTWQPSSAPAPLAAYAGHLYAWKGVDVFLRALAQAPDVAALIVGGHEAEPDLARMKALARDLGVAARVTFTGLLPPPVVAETLRRATMLVLPNPASAISTRFTSPLKLFEYLAAGRAIVASDLPAIREVLTDGADALLVPPGDAAALARALARLAADAPLAERLGRAAFDRAPEFSWDRRAERLEALFEGIRRRG
jgi:glycosyltransferase involved in cell wall biosynthesis